MEVPTSLKVSLFISLGYIPQSEIAGSYCSSILKFFEDPPYFSILGALIYIPTNSAEGILFLVIVMMTSLTGMGC